MGDEIETLVIGVRADTAGFSRDVAKMRAELEGPLAHGLDRAGRALEGALTRAITRGTFGFEDLRRVALSVIADIARQAVSAGLDALVGGKGGSGAGQAVGSLLGALLGLPGRATGGPVSGGRGYIVGERGPEIFVPTAAGRIEGGGLATGARDIRITVNVQGGRDASPERMARSGRQIARAVRSALVEAG
ncbi:tail tape measure protein [Sphingorhabdus soli]|uniref:Tail tape measure protein n=1 Tax=Flavisphingopyxis soli TaxID=2601267 RepID=A0A5C6U7W1_9SPHN|nr:tail tape measure protein [Sphingorhabdus soli]TXC68191.1 tail tape measure protein [Sphingorhabdus soli]